MKKTNKDPHIYWLVLFLMFADREKYFMHALATMNVMLFLKVLLSMCSPLAIRIIKPTRAEWKKALRYAKHSKPYPYKD